MIGSKNSKAFICEAFGWCYLPVSHIGAAIALKKGKCASMGFITCMTTNCTFLFNPLTLILDVPKTMPTFFISNIFCTNYQSHKEATMRSVDDIDIDMDVLNMKYCKRRAQFLGKISKRYKRYYRRLALFVNRKFTVLQYIVETVVQRKWKYKYGNFGTLFRPSVTVTDCYGIKVKMRYN